MGAKQKVEMIGGLVVAVGVMITLMGMQFGNFLGTWNITLGTCLLALGLVVIVVGLLTIMAAPDIDKKF